MPAPRSGSRPSALFRRTLTPFLSGLAVLAVIGGAVHCGDDAGGGSGPSPTGGSGGTAAGAGGSVSKGGSGGGGGTGGSGVPEEGPTPSIHKVDLLLVVDNSASMADKQAILAAAVPDLIGRLVQPDCAKFDGAGSIVERVKSTAGTCPAGYAFELAPLTDIHIGVISSSLGGHGSDQCNPAIRDEDDNDRAHLLTRGPTGTPVQTWAGTSGFLNWDPSGTAVPAGEGNAGSLVKAARDLVQGVGETGCGYESTLEATYRFLVDPNPPKSISVFNPQSSSLGPAEITGIDDDLLQQRAEFLRPDSFVVAMVLSDENDCSTVDGVLPLQALRDGKPAAGWTLQSNNGYPVNYVANLGSAGGKEFRMKSGTAACAKTPDSPDCKSCFLAENDPACRDLTREEDNLSLRCWDQKRRFGVDMLYPVQRYVDGFQEREVFDLRTPKGDAATLVPNPLFQDLPYLRYQQLKDQKASGAISQSEFDAKTARLGADIATRSPIATRDKRSIAFTAVVGVPWQDLAKDPTNLGAGYKSTETIDWTNVRTTDGAPPADPLMRESNQPRSGKHPITLETISASGENAINGHEWNSEGRDLMFACTSPLPVPKDCGATGVGSCDCIYGSPVNSASEIQAMADEAGSPLCQSAPGKPFGQVQYRAKALPGGRFVEVAHRLAGRSVLASVCAPNVTDSKKDDFGYRPVVSAVIDKLRPQRVAPLGTAVGDCR